MGERVPDQAFDLGRVADVDGDGTRDVTGRVDLGRDGPGALGIDVGHDDAGAFRSEQPGHLAPDPPSRAGDDRYPVGEFHRSMFLLAVHVASSMINRLIDLGYPHPLTPKESLASLALVARAGVYCLWS